MAKMPILQARWGMEDEAEIKTRNQAEEAKPDESPAEVPDKLFDNLRKCGGPRVHLLKYPA